MKICPNCNTQFPDDAKFCSTCGADITNIQPAQPIQQQAAPATENAPTPEAKKTPLKMIIIAAAAAIMLIIILITVSSLFAGRSDFDFFTDNIQFYTNADEENIVVFSNKDVVTLDGERSSYSTAYGGQAAYAIIDEELFIIEKKGETKIDSDVTGLKVSYDGKIVIYTKVADEDEGTIELYSWNGKESKKIDTDVYSRYVTISPDGSYVTYIKDFENDGDEVEFDTYISKNGKEGKKLEDLDGRAVIAISNDGKTTVSIDSEKEDLYITKGKTDTKLGSAEDVTYLAFNEDYSELFFVSNQKLYVSLKAGDKEKVENDVSSFGICIPTRGSIPSSYNYLNGVTVVSYGIDTFFGRTLTISEPETYDRTLFEIDKKLNVTTFKSGIDSYFITKNEKTLFFEKDGDLYKMKYGKEGTEEKIANDIKDTTISVDGKKVYYINEDDELCTISGSKEKILADDASNVAIADDGYVYYIEDRKDGVGDLYCLKGTGKPEAVDGGDDVNYLLSLKGTIVFLADYEDEFGTLRVADGKKSVVLAEEVR